MKAYFTPLGRSVPVLLINILLVPKHPLSEDHSFIFPCHVDFALRGGSPNSLLLIRQQNPRQHASAVLPLKPTSLHPRKQSLKEDCLVLSSVPASATGAGLGRAVVRLRRRRNRHMSVAIMFKVVECLERYCMFRMLVHR